MIKCDANPSGVASLHVPQLRAGEVSAFAAVARAKKNKNKTIRLAMSFFVCCFFVSFFCEKVIKEKRTICHASLEHIIMLMVQQGLARQRSQLNVNVDKLINHASRLMVKPIYHANHVS